MYKFKWIDKFYCRFVRLWSPQWFRAIDPSTASTRTTCSVAPSSSTMINLIAQTRTLFYNSAMNMSWHQSKFAQTGHRLTSVELKFHTANSMALGRSSTQSPWLPLVTWTKPPACARTFTSLTETTSQTSTWDTTSLESPWSSWPQQMGKMSHLVSSPSKIACSRNLFRS